jgi:hypothetical protein
VNGAAKAAAGGHQPQQRDHVLNAHALHVLRAARHNLAGLVDDGAERIVRPERLIDGHHVIVRVEQD